MGPPPGRVTWTWSLAAPLQGQLQVGCARTLDQQCRQVARLQAQLDARLARLDLLEGGHGRLGNPLDGVEELRDGEGLERHLLLARQQRRLDADLLSVGEQDRDDRGARLHRRPPFKTDWTGKSSVGKLSSDTRIPQLDESAS